MAIHGLKVEERVVDGLRLKTQQLPAMRGLELFFRLGRTLGPVLGMALEHGGSPARGQLVAAIAQAAAGVDPKEAVELAPEILATTSALVPQVTKGGRGGERLVTLDSRSNIDLVFSGRLLTLFKALAFALEVNFLDFIEGAQGAPGDQSPETADAAADSEG